MDLKEAIREIEKLLEDPKQKLAIKPTRWLFPGPWTEEEVRQAKMINDKTYEEAFGRKPLWLESGD